uniref:Uncharacterized protein n=1 Tax=Craspedostauros australis TaxID=1486917 RepID=A0A7R9WQK8_9STRA|mmetsp:Transcript_16171/g.44801  ORF Transcript_16171/g.44801 Transcript_16171/m.44801 type:complete len:151 (+) Transcript_16171:197-649(+)
MQSMLRKLVELTHSHPKSIMAGSMGLTVGSGIILYNLVGRQQQHELRAHLHKNKRHPMTPEEARVRAMIEQAKESTWQENLDRAFAAQDRFMLPGRDFGSSPKFVKQIDERSQQLLQKDEKEREDKMDKDADGILRRRRITALFWNDDAK